MIKDSYLRFFTFLFIFVDLFSGHPVKDISSAYNKIQEISEINSSCNLIEETKETFFAAFLNDYFIEYLEPKTMLRAIEKISFLVDKYQSRIEQNYEEYEFSADEYFFMEEVLEEFFKASFSHSNDIEANEIMLKRAQLFKHFYMHAYKEICGEDLHEWKKEALQNCDNDSLIFYFFEEYKVLPKREFFSDIHSSPLYFSRFCRMLNKKREENFNPGIMGGDLSDRPLLPLFKKNRLAQFFDLMLNQVHLINGLYVHYCLRNKKKENIFFLSTLGNHEEINVNLYNDKRIYNNCLTQELEEYFVWSINALTATIPVQIVFLDQRQEDNKLAITSASHAIGKQHFNHENKLVLFEDLESGVYCYKVNLKKSRLLTGTKINRDFQNFREYLKKEEYMHEEYYVKAYLEFLCLTENNLTSHILTRMDPFSGLCRKTGRLENGTLYGTSLSKSKEAYSKQVQLDPLSILEKKKNTELFLKFEEKRGFKIDELHYMFVVFKYIETENIKIMVPSLSLENKQISYHSCCGHQHDEDTLQKGFFINFDTGKIYLSSFYCDVESARGDKLYFSMCATCMNQYYLQFKKYIDIFKEMYPELFCLLEVDFNKDNRYENADELTSVSLLHGGPIEEKNHTKIINFLVQKIETNDPRIEKAKLLLAQRDFEKISAFSDRLLYQKIKELFDSL